MILVKSWPIDMNYLTCDNYTGLNTPERSIDLRSYFVDISEPATYGQFKLVNGNGTFNGYSTIAFDMNILAVSMRHDIDYHEQHLGIWPAGFMIPLKLESRHGMNELTPIKIYRVYTVVVNF